MSNGLTLGPLCDQMTARAVGSIDVLDYINTLTLEQLNEEEESSNDI